MDSGLVSSVPEEVCFEVVRDSISSHRYSRISKSSSRHSIT